MISPYLEKPLRTLEQALHERAAVRVALQNLPPDPAAQLPATRSESDAGSAEALALLLRDRPAAEPHKVRRAA